MDTPLTSSALEFVINHVFLPPKLPQKDDEDARHELTLLNLVIEALTKYEKIVNDHEKTTILQLRRIFHNAKSVIDTSQPENGILEDKLRNMLTLLDSEETSVPLYVRAQNAGVIISRINDRVLIEMFELSPCNEAVMGTQGRLRRSFPGFAVVNDTHTFSQQDFQRTIAQTLVRMSHQTAAGTRPQVRKAQQMHEENRDTTHPKLVTELLASFLRANGVVETISQIQKNTREEVLWSNCLAPWRRSALWLLIRVTLQLTINRLTTRKPTDQDLYKRFMLFFMSTLLHEACDQSFRSDILYVMNAKIARRVRKLQMNTNTPEFEYFKGADSKSAALLNTTWDKIRGQSASQDYRSELKGLDFQQDLGHSLAQFDGFVSSIASWKNISQIGNFQPSSELLRYGPSELPTSLKASPQNLFAFEEWVASSLSSWVDDHNREPDVCARIHRLLLDYHNAARHTYSGNPETTSRMLLVVLELWVACDTSARQLCSLVDDYDPGFPVELLQCLLLPTRSLMERLRQVEKYLSDRRQRARFNSDLFRKDFGTVHCFAVRYFDSSTDHQNCLSQIVEGARRERDQKRAEFELKKENYRNWMKMYDESECEYDIDSDGEESMHRPLCQHCSYLLQANSVTIDVHEWPLPDQELESKNVVFELNVPSFYGHWRDACSFVLHEVFQSGYCIRQSPGTRWTPAQFDGLRGWFQPFDNRQVIGLLSENKPHGVTHRRNKQIGHLAIRDVCLNNGLKYRYFDNEQGLFVGDVQTAAELQQTCTYTLPAQSTCLQMYLVRPPKAPSGPEPNAVIAHQAACPQHMSLLEFKALASLPLGFRLVWINILSQLSMPVVDFKKEETALVILQCIYQAGPAVDHDDTRLVGRATHTRLGEQVFGLALVAGLKDSIQTVRKNWDSLLALTTLVSLATRLLTLNSHGDVVTACLGFLSTARTVAREWLSILQSKTAAAVDDSARAELRLKVAEAALICVQTFMLDEENLNDVLQLESNASTLIVCCTAIHDGEHALSNISDAVFTRLHQLWKELSWRTYPIVSRLVVQDGSPCMDNALAELWQAYKPGGRWRSCPAATAHWLVMEHSWNNATSQFVVHYDLLSGTLLVNGLPLSRLPAKYEQHSMYQILFGSAIIGVMPSQSRGMQFSAKRPYAGYAVEFGMHDHNLRVLATTHSKSFMLVPGELLQGLFPVSFVNDHVHWYNTIDDSLEFRPIADPWTSTVDGWRLTRSGRGWQLLKHDVALINVNSQSAQKLSSLVAALDDCKHIHITYQPSKLLLELDLPRLQMGFFLTSTNGFMQSKQFRSQYIDPDQTLGTLVGLQDKLLLRKSQGARLLVLPEGNVSFTKHGNHVRVLVDKESVRRSHAYRVDPILGRLIDNGSLQSKLYLSYLHALTSFCLPDRLMGQTGTERAIEILQSAAVLSYDSLNKDNVDLLESIAQLTPGRQYYPSYERVMAQVQWNERISPLSQHSYFRHSVTKIFENVRRAAVFSTGEVVQVPSLGHVDSGLLSRDDIRSSCWRSAKTGEDAHTTKCDVIYKSRDRGQQLATAQDALVFTKLVCSSQSSVHFSAPHNAVEQLWNFLAVGGAIGGHQPSEPDTKLEYDAMWLVDSKEYLRKHWCYLQQQLHASQSSRFDIAMWLSTIAFGGKVEAFIIQIIVLFFGDQQMMALSPPPATSFQLSKGYTINTLSLSDTIEKAAKPLNQSPESFLERRSSESVPQFAARKQKQFNMSRKQTVDRLSTELQKLWPRQTPSVQNQNLYTSYINVELALRTVKPLFQVWHDNHRLRLHIEQIVNLFGSKNLESVPPALDPPFTCEPAGARGPAYIDMSSLFLVTSAPEISMSPPQIELRVLERQPQHSGIRSTQFIDHLATTVQTQLEDVYIKDLKHSLRHLQEQGLSHHLPESFDAHMIHKHHNECVEYVETLYTSICHSLMSRTDHAAIAVAVAQFPRTAPNQLLQYLHRRHWSSLPAPWRRVIVEYAKAVTLLQRAERCQSLLGNPTELCKEILNSGHSNWDPMEHPEALLLEVEHGFLIRPTQEEVAAEMRQPSTAHNTVMQLNMGEGKSSVIVPMVAASLADGSSIVRVITAKSLSKQMFQTLVIKLGGLLARRIYRLPFSRDLKLDEKVTTVIRAICDECASQGGVLLLQPENVLSMRLAGLDRLICGDSVIGKSMLSLQEVFDTRTRDIVDESDENFSVKFELIYTVGTQSAIEMGAARWLIVQQVFDLVSRASHAAAATHPSTIEIGAEEQGVFPRLRILCDTTWQIISEDVVEQICAAGLVGFPVARLSATARMTVQRYILDHELPSKDIAAMESLQQESFWSDELQTKLLLLRGLFAGGVLLFAFSQKRWRVNYGLTTSRTPPTQLAVPYRAKDDPSLRAEFSHPDVVIILSCLSYYYGGLSDGDLNLALAHLLRSDQADVVYQEWVRCCPNLPIGYRHVASINLQDRVQCVEELYPTLRRTKKVIDYFLAQLIFPKQLKAYPHKLSASGWDIGQIKTHPTTGFSGTNDSRMLLPVDVSYLDMPNQKYTNALILEYLLQPENSVLLMPPITSTSSDSCDVLLSMVVEQEPPVRVILDVGAQIIELDNIGVAKEWLRRMPDCGRTEAVVFFGEDDDLNVIDRHGKVESLQTSFYAEQLDLCLIFLDEAHTRGTDLKLPSNYRAAVTLGAKLTKDKLAQAVMRMRKFGQGQSVVFCVPHEIQTTILRSSPTVDAPSILQWAIGETCNDIQNSMPLWATQGERYLQQQHLWHQLLPENGQRLTERAKSFLEQESPSLEQRYTPGNGLFSTQPGSAKKSNDPKLAMIQARCSKFGNASSSTAALQEEQQRELSPEIERERQVYRPARAEPANHFLHPDLVRLVKGGDFDGTDSVAWQPAFQMLARTTAANLMDLTRFPIDLLATSDFARTISKHRSKDLLDDYQRAVQWVLRFSATDAANRRVERLMIISPYEAHEILPMVSQADKVSLHLYAPRTSLSSGPLDELCLYHIGDKTPAHALPPLLKILLNLFAGQVYFQSFDEYRQVCDFLGLAWTKTADGDVVSADGFILSSTNNKKGSRFNKSPVAFLRALMSGIRYHGETIDKTHMGILLNGGLLKEDDLGQ